MKRLVMMLTLAAFLVAALMVSAVPAFAACVKERGQWTCTTTTTTTNPSPTGKKFSSTDTTTTTTTSRGNLENKKSESSTTEEGPCVNNQGNPSNSANCPA